MNINFDWSKQVTDLNGEGFKEDQLDRVKYARFLTSFLSQQGFDDSRDEKHKKRNYVLNLNAEWGSGKTYFLKRWAHDLQDHYPVVYIDAWKQDYSDDPLMTVISSMIKQLREQTDKDADKTVFKVSRKLLGLLKAAAPTLARSIATKYLGIDPLKIMEMADDQDIGENIDIDGKQLDMGFAAQEMVKHLISEHDSKSKAINRLKHNVEQWVGAVTADTANADTKKSYPAFIFIDELDRCRPSYAVEMLEAIKHIFDIQGVVFVIATDTEQLQHAVKAIYGEGFNAKQYLGRFFNSRYTFKAPSYENMINVHCDVDKLSDDYLKKKEIITFPYSLDQVHDESKIALKNLTIVYDALGLSARQAIQVTDRLIATIDNMSSNKCLNIVYLAFLLSLLEKDSELYDLLCKYSFSATVKFNDSSYKLEQHLRSKWFLDDKNLTFYLSPSTIKPHFNNETDNGFRSNQWEDGIYECSLFSFVRNIHDYLQANNQTRDNHINQSYIEHVRRLSNNDEMINFSRGQFWVKPAFHQKSLPSVNVSYYKDLVELATNLDHIDAD